uniref:GATA-type domain-containing protein n=1 Tax=Panagrellus redivivus TaxID=6233 RepID=A0A7E4V8U8_PANRE
MVHTRCAMCDCSIATTSTEPSQETEEFSLCSRCFPFGPLVDGELDIGWLNEIMGSPGSSDDDLPTSNSSTDETSTPSTPSTSPPSMPALTTSNVCRKRRHAPEDKQCANCGTTKTSMWRRNPEGNPLCNACGQHFKKFNMHRPSELAERPIKKRMRKADSSSQKPDLASTFNAIASPFQMPVSFDMYGSNLGPMQFSHVQPSEFLPPPPMHPGWNNPMPFPPPAPWAFKYPVQQYY